MTTSPIEVRHDWTTAEVSHWYTQPFNDLLFHAQWTHRQCFDPNRVQVSTLISIKTGGCAEDCGYCSQSAHHDTGLTREKFISTEKILDAARAALANGATRFCMGAAWSSPPAREMERLCELVRAVKGLGLETCMTLGMLDGDKARALQQSGLDYYNHNLDTSPEYYAEVVSTRTYQDRLDTLHEVRAAGMRVCCGGIIGMGEQRGDRIEFLKQLANLPEHPQSVPINLLVPIVGTPMEHTAPLDVLEWVRTIAVARLIMPYAYVRLSAGRTVLSDEAQALCFLAGANSIFYGDRLLTTDNPAASKDRALFERLGIQPSAASH